MSGIIDYLDEYGDITFKEHPFNEVDALVLSQFVYLKWEHVIPGLLDNSEDGVTLLQMKELMQPAEVFSQELYAERNSMLWERMVSGKRFQNMRCNYISYELRDEVGVQFLAFTVFPEDSLPVILFRGTDETILGWKEDYAMTMDTPVAGQRLASLYLKQVALRLPGGFNIAGHSKGGNLAVYSAFMADAFTMDRIMDIYNFDGPHYRPEVIALGDYERVKDKIHKYIPNASIIGIMLETEHDYSIIKSKGLGGGKQHDPYSWETEDDHFIYLDKMEKRSLKMNDSMNLFTQILSNEQLEILGDFIFEIIGGDYATTTEEMAKNKSQSVSSMLAALKDIEPKTKKAVKNIIKELKNL